MNIKKYIGLVGLAALAFPFGATAQTLTIGFEDASEYTGIGVYDSWADSPFMTGELAGNVQIINNDKNIYDETTGDTINKTDKMLAFQRSRFGGNLYGARIDLAEPIRLSSTTQYVHVYIYKEKAGRVLLTGLGRRSDRPWQNDTEQFNVVSSNTVEAGVWTDAVFAVTGSDSAMVYSFVVVPDCESTHDLSADFAAYIDEIEVSSASSPRITYGYYPINFDEDDVLERTDRYTNSISLVSGDGEQSITVDQQTTLLVYNKFLDQSFKATPGETVTATFGYTGSYMHGYVYLDYNNDGKFSYELNSDYSIPTGSDLMTYSYYEGVNSDGESSTTTTTQPPSFTIPSDMEPGFYRMRYKIDWNNVDPGGNGNESNHIADNGGIVVDTRLNVHGDKVTIYRGTAADGVGGLNGDILFADGSDFTTAQIPFGEDFTIKSSPANGFELNYVIMRHGYNLEGDSLLYDTPQYEDVILPAYLFSNDLLTIPGEYIDGNVRLIPYFSATSGDDTPSDVDYPTNFDKDTLAIKVTASRLSKFSLAATNGGTSSITVRSAVKTIYQDMTNKQASIVPGDEVTTSTTFTGDSMHVYLYIDYDQDGQFNVSIGSDGKPTYASELVAYSYYNGHNSAGETVGLDADCSKLPTFTVNPMMQPGVYRGRLKVDYNNSDPGGTWVEGSTTNIDDRGGYIIDFLVNIHKATHALKTFVTNGSVHDGTSTTSTEGLPEAVELFAALSLRMAPVTSDYTTDSITIRHGHLDKEQYIHGNRQWSEYTRKYSRTFSIPKDSVNGEVYIYADFEPSADAEYVLVFSDEFDGEDGSLPNSENWIRPTRYASAWNRFLSKTDEEHAAVGYIEDGKFVAKCIPNTEFTDDAVDMISGGISSSGLHAFTYGRFEARIKTEAHSGNFPAFWMMPQDNSAGWPYAGEIDIWEQINSENIAYHTIHSEWANILGNTSDPTRSGSTSGVTTGNYHTFGLLWTESKLTWYVDGKQTFSYAKSTDESDLENGQWPFDAPFYIIMNQSVGNGSWASSPDVSHTYTTLFDWVRVYQIADPTDGIGNVTTNTSGIDVYASRGKIRVVAEDATNVIVVDMAGRKLVNENVQGNKDFYLSTGVYVVNNKKVYVP